jgi:hypothetical protein
LTRPSTSSLLCCISRAPPIHLDSEVIDYLSELASARGISLNLKNIELKAAKK